MRFFLTISILICVARLCNGYIYPLCKRYGGLCEDANNESLLDEDLTIMEWLCSIITTGICYIYTVITSIGRIYECACSEGWLFFYQDEKASILDSVLNFVGIELASRSNKRKECFYSVYILLTWIFFVISFTYCVILLSRKYQRSQLKPRILRSKTDMFGRSVSCCDCTRLNRL